jgi:GrpB-like predicted nucleotidyltransferase (UPF0157 family)
VKIDPFDEAAIQRKIVPYQPVYRELFLSVQEYVQRNLKTVELFHIGSTAIADLRGKPMLDIVAVTSRSDLREEQLEFQRIGFHRRNVWVDRDDKPYICGSVTHAGQTFNINVHVCHRNDPVHKDALAFIQILNRRPDLRRTSEAAARIGPDRLILGESDRLDALATRISRARCARR